VTEPEIRAIAKLELKPGDTLVVFMARDRMSEAALVNITRTHRALHGDNVKLMLVPDDIRIGVLKAAEAL
jgi:hypothetical protein